METKSFIIKEEYTYIEQYENAISSAKLLAETRTLEQIDEMIKADGKYVNTIYHEARRLKTTTKE